MSRTVTRRLAALTWAAGAIESASPEPAVLLARESGKVAGDCRGLVPHLRRQP
ncbi:hypothetical protein [Actinoplanes sp. NPDC051851]|uniref:hypothetical protein n=1 Tax=Actinoplanes sp. NPDC051851 TaxID=3154753 RepID=UPI00344914D1